MSEVSRRQFLQRASIGAAAVGALAATGTGVLSALDASGSTGSSMASGSSEEHELLEGSDVFARVVDAKSGQMKVYVGSKAFDLTSRAVAQELVRAAR